ncbi:tyrosine-type recombinase/integrase [Micromonospora arida]|uniref:tyrosine-type recombinase/integrase n=1 Tax=Micromonospora arida TaxID=2203715 RepID=UPI0033B09EAC
MRQVAAATYLVFASTIGTAMEPRNVNRRFEQLRAAAGLDWLHLHDLRHAFATFLLDQGEELRTVMELLAHSTIRMTADTYGHVLPARARQTVSAIDRILGQEGQRDRLGCTRTEFNRESAGGAQGTRTLTPALQRSRLLSDGVGDRR